MTRQLYYSPGACSLAAHILLEESGLPYDLVRAVIAEGATASETFRRLNPKGRVPVLVDEGRVLTELPAISWYVALHGDGLLPSDPFAQARALEWFNWLSGTVHGQGFGALWRPARFTPDTALHPALQEQARRTIADGFDVIDSRLQANGPWALGADYTLVDPFLFVLYRWSLRIGMPSPERYPHWTTHAQRMLARPAVVRAVEQEGLALAEFDPLRS